MEKLANSKVSKVSFDAQDNRHTTEYVTGLSAYYHRLLSLGHDPILGLIFGVYDILNGKMTTIDKTGKIVSQVMENYADRKESDIFAAIAKQIVHFKSDITTSMGLPAPLMALFNLLQFGSIGEEEQTIAEIVQGMYYEGYDFIHFCSMSIPTMIIEVRENALFYVADFSAIEARVIAWFAGESWRQQVFEKGGDIYCASASQMFKVPVEKHGINGHLRQKGKIAELALGYGGSVGALKAMGALDMGLSEDELPALVDAWRQANPRIVEFWWAVDRAVMEAVKYKHTTTDYGLTFSCKSGMLFIALPSGRKLAYVKPKIGTNKFGGSCITYEGVGGTKKWERLDSYGPKFVENIVQATARDILCYAMKTLRCCSIVMHIHDELVIEADPKVSLDAICEQMGRTPPWAKGLLLRADGYTTPFYKKD